MFNLRRYMPMKTARKMMALTANWNASSQGEPKFSEFINDSAALASNPMMAGRNIAKMFFCINESNSMV